ncbi:FtsP/CotA-like multicopper oxidase with cupredoxin domain [Kitasatospora sp. MAP12-15]|uniref:multicopper oxidase domain-containing protein n=1 Tax=unclassified Kitasatospora TaxID=2633591 RepID=UPI0024752C85|nr:multicopper oxidase domain-containing protein [Kitasatospora sp. MAP12-44]MDH6114999.1 FtsP/CotA-like multicopper oxidase with cupredoxin domain [Kitasatospora sp. MAP12-44]
MPVDRAHQKTHDDRRRTVLRTLLGGGALAGFAATAQLGATAQAEADPFAAEEVRPGGRVREYWLQADSFQHNAVPNGQDGMTGMRFTADQTTFWAVGFRAYTADWGRPLDADASPQGIGDNSGIPGPVLRAEVGDTLRVHFRNNDEHYRWPHSLHPHGVWYDQDNDGGWLADDTERPGTAVPFGADYTYTWICRPSSVGTWPYHDHSVPQAIQVPGAKPKMPVMEIGAELGLFGVIAVTDRHTPAVDREFVLFCHDATPGDIPSLAQGLNLFNGGAFVDNTPTFTAKAGERVRWRIAALGNETHVFHLHGHRWRSPQGYQGWVDSQIIAPSTTVTIEYTEDNPGDWIYHCHVVHHMMGGMVGRYRVSP